jgi:hypothetical protein
MKYSKGIMWLDDCRIPFVDGDITINHNTQPGSFVGSFGSSETIYKENTKGRFTPNLLVCDDMLNDGNITKGQKNPRIQKTTRRYGENNFTNGGLFTPEGNITDTYNDKGSSSRYYDLDLWFDNMIERL